MEQYRYEQNPETQKNDKKSKNKMIVIGTLLLTAIVVIIILYIIISHSKKEVDTTKDTIDYSEVEKETEIDLYQNKWSTNVTEVDKELDISYAKESTNYFTALIAQDAKQIVSKTKVEKASLLQASGNSAKYDGGTYTVTAFELDIPLLEEKQVSTCTYLLENCPGMMTNQSPGKSDVIKGNTHRSVPYEQSIDQTEKIYVSVPYTYKDDMKEEFIIRALLENARVRQIIRYEDGSEQVNYYGFERCNPYNCHLFNVYLLELEE